MSFGRASKYVIWSGIEICHLVGCQNMSIGRASNYFIWSGAIYGRALNYVVSSCVEICLVVRQNMSFGWASIYNLVGRRNISFGNLSFGRASKFVIWSGVKICHLVGRQIISFGRVRYMVGR